jgi:hypothetical protein
LDRKKRQTAKKRKVTEAKLVKEELDHVQRSIQQRAIKLVNRQLRFIERRHKEATKIEDMQAARIYAHVRSILDHVRTLYNLDIIFLETLSDIYAGIDKAQEGTQFEILNKKISSLDWYIKQRKKGLDWVQKLQAHTPETENLGEASSI